MKKYDNAQDLAEDVVDFYYPIACKMILNAGYTHRLVCQDGAYCIITADYKLDRINLTIEKNIVTKATVG